MQKSKEEVRKQKQEYRISTQHPIISHGLTRMNTDKKIKKNFAVLKKIQLYFGGWGNP